MFELRRSDIGFGKLVLDERGIVREKLFRTQRIAWNDVREYRLKIELRQRGRYVFRTVITDVVDLVEGFKGNSRRIYGMELFGANNRVTFNWRYRDTLRAIEYAIQQLEPRITETARATLRSVGIVRFGDFSLAAHGIGYRDHEPVAFAHVEAIEFFDQSPLVMRIMKRGKVFPYEKVTLQHLPNPHAFVTLAGELGYPILGKQFLPLMELPVAKLTHP